MAANTKITVDGVQYDVGLVFDSLSRSFEIMDGINAGTAINGKSIRDIIGTRYSYQLQIEPMPQSRADYDALYEVLSAPTARHSVSFPYGQTTISFDCQIISGTDTYHGIRRGQQAWQGLTIDFIPIEPQRRS